MMDDDKLEQVKRAIGRYDDFPKEGVVFRDVFGALLQPETFAALRDLLVARARLLPELPDVVVALDARGFLFGPLLALQFQRPFVPVRKRGKLPGAVLSATYDLEYAKDTFEIQEGSIRPGQKVLIVDDLLATGGSMSATCGLLERMGAVVTACLVVIELKDLDGRGRLSPRRVESLVVY